jgi:hypothetical protein
MIQAVYERGVVYKPDVNTIIAPSSQPRLETPRLVPASAHCGLTSAVLLRTVLALALALAW